MIRPYIAAVVSLVPYGACPVLCYHIIVSPLLHACSVWAYPDPTLLSLVSRVCSVIAFTNSLRLFTITPWR